MTIQSTQLLNNNIDTLTDADMEAIAMQLNAIEPGAGEIVASNHFWSDIITFLDSTMILDAIVIIAICYMVGIIALNIFPSWKKIFSKNIFTRKAS